jgi:hypothetical protein
MVPPYNSVWDAKLNELMRTERFTNLDSFTAQLGSRKVWVANHPYASFKPPHIDIRPSRMTIYNAHKKLMREISNE